MTLTSITPSGYPGAGPSSIDAGPFVLTLCEFEGPVSIRPSQSPQLRRFTFFTTSAPDRAGGAQVHLHMGYFETLTDAESLLPAVRRRFPGAIATRTPVAEAPLTDTQVMKVLEARGAVTPENEAGQSSSAQIAMLRPEDTSVRRALKEAVVQGAPVFFAVQLEWSAQPIDRGRVPPLAIFKTHTPYAMESRREGRSRYFLRFGFFPDAASAKEAAFSVRSRFASAVVVPVTEQEITCAREASTNNLGLAHVCLPIYETPDRSEVSSPGPPPKPTADRFPKPFQEPETIEQTLETLAAREMWNDPDSVSDTGVRHLKFEVLARKSRER